MPLSKAHCLELPAEFPLASFEAFYDAARERLPKASEVRREFNGASNLIAWRFRACIESQDAFFASWADTGPQANHEVLYQREKYLFAMFSSGVSALEATSYGCHALASAIKPP